MDHDSMCFLSCSLQLLVTGLFPSLLVVISGFHSFCLKKKAEIFTYWYLFQNTKLWLKNKNQ